MRQHAAISCQVLAVCARPAADPTSSPALIALRGFTALKPVTGQRYVPVLRISPPSLVIESDQSTRRRNKLCLNCGCGEYNERHKPTDITSDDLKAAADGQNMDIEQAANNIHQGAMAPKQAHSS